MQFRTLVEDNRIGSADALESINDLAITGVWARRNHDGRPPIDQFPKHAAQAHLCARKVWAEKEKIRVPLLSDYDHVVTKTYGVAYDQFAPDRNLPMGGVPKRSAFIIDRNGVIQYAEESDNPRQLPNFDAIKAKLNELA